MGADAEHSTGCPEVAVDQMGAWAGPSLEEPPPFPIPPSLSNQTGILLS